MIKLCIFDLDGTVADTINSIAFFANQSLKKFGLPTIETQVYRKIVGNGVDALIKNMIEISNGTQEDYLNVREHYIREYNDNFLYLTKPYDDIPELLEKLKAFGIKVAILSNKPHQTTVQIAAELFGDTVDLCYGACQERPLKPDPSAVFEIMDKFDVKAKECVYIGDTETDMLTGKNASVFTVGVLWGFRDFAELNNAQADRIIKFPLELIDIIQFLNSDFEIC
ncbi:MAG: HAD family hydrolase [bacterium]|nr:HAD family hydrolase [bacterium]